MFIEKCQNVSAAQGIRISFLSGDVHVCAAGRLYSDPKVNTQILQAFVYAQPQLQPQLQLQECMADRLLFTACTQKCNDHCQLASSSMQRMLPNTVKVNSSIQTHATSCYMPGARVLQPVLGSLVYYQASH